MNRPLVSVIMPVYNTESFVGASLKSILDQTYTNLQVVVVNDGSTDGSEAVIRSFNDPRIIYLSQPNGGVSRALNTALDAAIGSLIARQDSDDISAPERIAEQVTFFGEHPGTVILGTWGTFMDGHPEPERILERPLSDAAIRFAVLFDSPFVSTSVMFRAAAIERTGGFDTSQQVWDDYDMWSRMVAVGKAANLPKRLVGYRVLASGLTKTNTRAVQWLMEQRKRNIEKAIPSFPPDLLGTMLRMGIDHPLTTAANMKRLARLLRSYIHSITGSEEERRALEHELRTKLMSCRIVQHHSFFHRVADHLVKRITLMG
jgi:glycosyltransferase involved in cell wall biosynthesis